MQEAQRLQSKVKIKKKKHTRNIKPPTKFTNRHIIFKLQEVKDKISKETKEREKNSPTEEQD